MSGAGVRTTVRRRAAVVGALVLALQILALAGPRDLPPAAGDVGDTATIVAAGDIACSPGDGAFNGGAGTTSACRMRATSDVAISLAPDAVLTLGDNQYDDGTFSDFLQSYDPTWGRVKPITHPSAGNHEYNTPGAVGYYAYFGAAAGDPARGYYSYDLASWHVVVLNSNCAGVGGCETGSPQDRWLRADLAAHAAECTLAYWHHPLFSSSSGKATPLVQPLWNALYAYGADVVLNGHAHNYERFAPQDPTGKADALHGIREFVVGTGGNGLDSLGSVRPNTEARAAAYGVIALNLRSGGYDWQFHNDGSSTFTDAGSASCVSPTATPLAEFSATPTFGSAPVDVQFADASAGSPTAWAWDFGDGTTSTVQSPSHTYGSPGRYAVRLTATNTNGSSTVTKPGYVSVAPSGRSATFEAIADAQVSSGSPSRNFGDAVTLRVRSDDYRSYAKFQVTGASGAVVDARLRLYITDPSPDGGSVWPVASNWAETGGTTSEPLLTWASAPALSGSALGGAGNALAGTWTDVDVTPAVYGDGVYSFAIKSSSTNNVIFSSREGGSAPRLIVTFAEPSAPAAPVASFVATPTSGTGPLQVTFADTSTGPPTSWLWDFGDGTTSTAPSPSHSYAAAGSYDVALTVANDFGTDTMTRSSYITVIAAPPSNSFVPVADAYVQSSKPTKNFGAATFLKIRTGSPTCTSFLRFDLTSVPASATITSAKLRLKVTDGSRDGGTLYRVASGWQESTVTWAAQPALVGGPVAASVGTVSTGAVLELDVTGALTGAGVYDFGLVSGSTNSAIFASRETSTPPVLVLTFASP